MYAEDDDISWKLWLAGYQGIHVTNAVLHHRSSAEDGVWEVRDFTRYLVNRNTLVVVAKNAQHVLLLCLPVQLLLLLAEGLVFLVARRSWRFVWKCYIKAPLDAFKMWRHVLAMRRLNRQHRCRSDWEMARMFLKFRINRWDMLKSMLRGQRSLVKPTV
jgi:GT2 family glycosyltransferase